jgi:hypothetical protein
LTETNTNRTDDNCFNSKYNKSNENNDNRSSLSDNEVIMRTKIKLLSALTEVTKNMIKERKTEGKEIYLKIEPNIIKESELINELKENNNELKIEEDKSDNRFSFNANNAKEDIKEKDIKITIEDKNVEINENKVISQSKKKKENCKCNCIIF